MAIDVSYLKYLVQSLITLVSYNSSATTPILCTIGFTVPSTPNQDEVFDHYEESHSYRCSLKVFRGFHDG